MSRTFLFTIVCACVAAITTPAAAHVRLLQERNGTLSVRVDFTSSVAGAQQLIDLPGVPQVPYKQFLVAIPPSGDFRVTMSGGRSEDRAGDLPQMGTKEGNAPETAPAADGMLPEQPFDVVGPYMYRKTRVIAINCYGSQVDYSQELERVWAGYDIHVSYPAAARTTARRNADPMLRNLVINDLVFPAPDTGTRPERTAAMPADPHFDNSPNWVKVRLSATGAYQINGSALAASGINLTSIQDPTSFRLFTAGGREQERWNGSGQPYQDPEGTWNVGKWMTECDILVEYGGDGSFDPNDRVIFHGVAQNEWEDLYESGVSRSAFYRHSRASENVYYLSWDDGGGFGGSPARMTNVGSAPGAGPDVTSFQERFYFEKDRVERLNFGGDGWVWFDITSTTSANIFVQQFTIDDLVTSQPQTFETLALAPYCYTTACFNSGANTNHQVFYRINGSDIGQITWDVRSTGGRYKNGVPVSITGNLMTEGTNILSLNLPRVLNTGDFMYFAHFSVFYERMLKAKNDRMLFSSPGTAGTETYSVSDFTNSGSLYVFDISDAYHPANLTGFSTTGTTSRTIRFDATAGANRQYFWAGTEAGFRTPDSMERYSPVDLRNITAGPHMVIVAPPEFLGAANVMKAHRENIMPFYSTPRVTVATTDQVYDNFSGGQPDPMAIRNYAKFLYDNYTESGGAPSLSFLLLLGDANQDFHDNLKSQNVDWVTTGLNLDPRFDAYVTDDWFALLDAADSRGRGLTDIGVGRLPAGSVSEAQFLVDKVIAYETSRDFDPWRDRVVLVADDEVSPSFNNQAQFVQQSEIIAHFKPSVMDSIYHLAPYLEAYKVYLTEYPKVGGIKPESRIALLDVWNRGALLINYIGHGSTAQLADEQVFVESDVGGLFNGLRLPLFMALSCTVGDFAAPSGRSLSEKLILRDGGGTIANVTASELTFIGNNAIFAYRIFEELFPYPQEPGFPVPLGTAIGAARAAALMRVFGDVTTEENNQKYNLLGDPALRIVAPHRTVRLDSALVDTLTTAKRHIVRGAVYSGNVIDTGFNGSVQLTVREPDQKVVHLMPGGTPIVSPYYRYRAGTVFEGTADVSAGEFEFDFRVPQAAATGEFAFVRAYANNGVEDAVALKDDTYFVVRAPGDTIGLQPIDGPPSVDMGFQDGLTKVKTGAVLQADVEDPDGINTLNTTPEGKIAIIFDNNNVPLDVTDFFEFEHGGSDRRGTLAFPLPDLPVGPHNAILKVSDSFGQIRLDTLQFSVTDPQDYSAEVLFNYPNPFADETRLLFSLNHPATIQVEIFTLSGRRIRKLRTTRDAGAEVWILWDGRDEYGASIANGTYLYVAKVEFTGIQEPPLTLRGKMVKIR